MISFKQHHLIRKFIYNKKFQECHKIINCKNKLKLPTKQFIAMSMFHATRELIPNSTKDIYMQYLPGLLMLCPGHWFMLHQNLKTEQHIQQ